MRVRPERIPIFLAYLLMGIILTVVLMFWLELSRAQALPLAFFVVLNLQRFATAMGQRFGWGKSPKDTADPKPKERVNNKKKR